MTKIEPAQEVSAPTGPLPSRSYRAHPRSVARMLQSNARGKVPLLVAIVAVLAFADSRSQTVLSVTNFENIFQQTEVIGILAVGATILMIAGQFDLSVGSVTSLGSIVAAWLLVHTHLGSGTAVAVVVAMSVAIGLLIGVVVVVTNVAPFIVTLGGLSVFAALASIISDATPIASPHYTFLVLDKVAGIPVPLIVGFGLPIVGFLMLRYTRFGRFLFAVGSNRSAARIAGVPTAQVVVAAYAFNGLLVGFAGVALVGFLGGGDPNGASGFELQAITAAVLGGASLTGGRGSMLGTWLSVLFLGAVSNALNIIGVQASYSELVLGGVLVIAVVLAAIGEARRSQPGSMRQVWRELLQVRRRLSKEAVPPAPTSSTATLQNRDPRQ
jgi:ribose/xylose/arabinose/galactoside ABC-type transport system permease subunit